MTPKKSKRRKKKTQGDPILNQLHDLTSLVQDLLILVLGLNEVTHREIRKILEVDIRRVTRILKPIEKARKKKRRVEKKKGRKK